MYRLTEVEKGFAIVRDLRGCYRGGVYYTPKHGWVAEPVLYQGKSFKTRRAAAEYVSAAWGHSPRGRTLAARLQSSSWRCGGVPSSSARPT